SATATSAAWAWSTATASSPSVTHTRSPSCCIAADSRLRMAGSSSTTSTPGGSLGCGTGLPPGPPGTGSPGPAQLAVEGAAHRQPAAMHAYHRRVEGPGVAGPLGGRQRLAAAPADPDDPGSGRHVEGRPDRRGNAPGDLPPARPTHDGGGGMTPQPRITQLPA